MADYPIVILPLSEEEGGGYLGFVPDLQGCLSDGDSEIEALHNTKLAIQEWLDVQHSRGMDIPAPGTAAKRGIEKERALLDVIKALADYRESADGKIRNLERKLSELIATLRDDTGRSRYEFAMPEKFEGTKLKRAH